MTTHEFKVWPAYYVAMEREDKNFEVRDMADRQDEVLPGHVLHLREYDERAQAYTGREMWKTVSYVLPGGTFGLPPNLYVFGLRPGKCTIG